PEIYTLSLHDALPIFDLTLRCLRINRLLVLRVHVGALGDRLREAVRRQQLEVKVFAEGPEDALAVADRYAREACTDFAAQGVVAGERPGQKRFLLVGEVARIRGVE